MGKALWEVPVTYTAIGASASPDLLRHPPAGYRARVARARIGHGDERWDYARRELLTWGVKRNSGFEVEPVAVPDSVLGSAYVPVTFDENGEPLSAAHMMNDHVVDDQGREFVRPGQVVILSIGVGPIRIKEPVRVMAIEDGPLTSGFTYGTLPGHPVSGEESFTIDRQKDGTIWLTVRAFYRAGNRLWWVLFPVMSVVQSIVMRRYLRSLSGALESDSAPAQHRPIPVEDVVETSVTVDPVDGRKPQQAAFPELPRGR